MGCSNASCSIRGTLSHGVGQTTACPSPTGSSCTCCVGLYRPMLLGRCPALPQAIRIARARYVRLFGPCNTSTDSSYACGSCTGGNYSSFAQCGSVVAEEAEVDVAGGYVPSCYGQCKTPPNGGTYSSMPTTSSLCSVGNQ